MESFALRIINGQWIFGDEALSRLTSLRSVHLRYAPIAVSLRVGCNVMGCDVEAYPACGEQLITRGYGVEMIPPLEVNGVVAALEATRATASEQRRAHLKKMGD